MKKTRKGFFDFALTARDLREIIMLAILAAIAAFLLHSSFDRVSEKTVIKISTLSSTASYHVEETN